MFKSLTIKCRECPNKEKVIGYQLFEKYSGEGYQCGCGHLPYYPSHKLFYYADQLRRDWKWLPNNGVTPIAVHMGSDFIYGAYIESFTFRIKSQRQKYQAFFKESHGGYVNDAIHVFMPDDIEFAKFHDYSSRNSSAWANVERYLACSIKWNREAIEFYRETGGLYLSSIDVAKPPGRLAKHQ